MIGSGRRRSWTPTGWAFQRPSRNSAWCQACRSPSIWRCPTSRRNAIGLVSGRELRRRAEATLARWGAADIRPSDIVSSLPLGMRQRVEIIRALARNPSVLLLDEPTSALSDREWLFGLIDRVLKEGVSILYITHKLDEIRRLCRRCIILRNGRKVLDQAVSAMSNDDIFRIMAGRSAVEQFIAAPSSARPQDVPASEASHLTGEGIEDISFALAARRDVSASPGWKATARDPCSALWSGCILCTVGGSRWRPGRPVCCTRRGSLAQRAWCWCRRSARPKELFKRPIDHRQHLCARYPARQSYASPEQAAGAPARGAGDSGCRSAEHFLPLPITDLSGGSQQKAMLARALVVGAHCLLLFDPTRGVDVGAKQSIYRMMRAFVHEGGAVPILLHRTRRVGASLRSLPGALPQPYRR